MDSDKIPNLSFAPFCFLYMKITRMKAESNPKTTHTMMILQKKHSNVREKKKLQEKQKSCLHVPKPLSYES